MRGLLGYMGMYRKNGNQGLAFIRGSGVDFGAACFGEQSAADKKLSRHQKPIHAFYDLAHRNHTSELALHAYNRPTR